VNSSTASPVLQVLRRIGFVVAGYLSFVGAIWVLDGRPLRAPVGGDDARGTASSNAGRQVWLDNGCASCHSLIGLGGHVGPDLTDYGRPELASTVRSTVRLGRATMPRFELSDRQLDELLAYLDVVSRTARYPPRSLAESAFGETQ